MEKKVTISIIIIFLVVVIGFGIWKFELKNNSSTKNTNSIENEVINSVNISAEYITDDCVNEWTDYAKTIEQDVESASNPIVNENTHYIIKDINGYIYVYYIDDTDKEVLYKKTDISTEYLSAKDLDDLEIGIEIVGAQELNKLLEDFE